MNTSNLRPWPPGTSGNPAGKPRGAKHLSKWIQEMMEDENFTCSLSSGKVFTGAPVKAIVMVLVTKALEGDLKAIDMIGKYAYGSKLDLTSGESSVRFNFAPGTKQFINTYNTPGGLTKIPEET